MLSLHEKSAVGRREAGYRTYGDDICRNVIRTAKLVDSANDEAMSLLASYSTRQGVHARGAGGKARRAEDGGGGRLFCVWGHWVEHVE